MLVRMAKVHIIGHRSLLDPTLAALQRLGCIHLIDVSADPSVPLPPMSLDEDHRQEVEDLRFLRARLEGLLDMVPELVPRVRMPPMQVDLEQVRRDLSEAGPRIEELVERLDALMVERDTLPRHIETLRRLLPLLPSIPELETYDTAAVILDVRHAGVLGELNVELQNLLGANFEIISDRVDPDTVGAVVVFPKRSRSDVDALFGRRQVSRVRLPHDYEAVPFRQAISAMDRRMTEIPLEITATREEIADLVRARSAWPAASHQIADRLDQLDAVRRLGATPHTFIVSGWVPRNRLDEVASALTEAVGTGLVIEEVHPEKGEQPPVLLSNPAPARPFESLVGLLALPRADSLDPTVLMAIFLPLFFGMMLGDVAYGTVVVVLALVAARKLRERAPTATDIARVVALCGAWSIVWGVVYGEFLGNLGHELWGWEPLWINREEALEPLLIFALAVGGGHVLLGAVLGVWQGLRDRDRKVTTERIGTLVSLVGLFLVAGVVAGRLPEGTMTPAVAAVAVGLVVVMVIGGPMGILMGPLELIGVVGNVLSYLRLAAIGLASVYLARVANELGATGPIWMGVIIATLFHALNLALGTFSPTIQALRLHYVEFFGRFFEEGGRAYHPFGGGGGPVGNLGATTGKE
jgi:V/A-type H+-transporting ATPase subunit I